VYSIVRYLCTGLKIQDSRKEKSRVRSLKEQSQTLGLRLMYICNRNCYFGWFGDFVIDFSISRARGPYMYNLPYAYAYALT